MHEERTSGDPAATDRAAAVSGDDVWTFRSESATAGTDVTGFRVKAADGEIGRIDQATHEVGASYLVVDTGPWIFGQKVLVPAGIVERVDLEAQTVFLSRTKDEIENAPELDTSAGPRDDVWRARVGAYYGAGRSGTHPNEPGFTS
jgi:hypothetical protein